MIVPDLTAVEAEAADNYRLRKARNLNIDILREEFIEHCVKLNKLVDCDEYKLKDPEKKKNFQKGKIKGGHKCDHSTFFCVIDCRIIN